MRAPRLRLTGLMALIAVFALILFAARGWRQWQSCREWARYHAWEDWRLRGNAEVYLGHARQQGAASRWAPYCEAGKCVRLAAWHEAQAARYRRAAWSLWASLPAFEDEPPWGATPPEPSSWEPSLPGLRVRPPRPPDGAPQKRPTRAASGMTW